MWCALTRTMGTVQAQEKGSGHSAAQGLLPFVGLGLGFDFPAAFYPPDLDRTVDSPALSGRGSRPSGRTSG